MWPDCVTNRPEMDTQQETNEMKVEVKARVPLTLKRAVSRLAKRRMVSTSDIVREAIDALIRKEREAA